MPREPQTGSLHLPKDIGVSSTDAQKIENRWDTIEAVDAQLKKYGIHTNVQPDVVCPEVTTEILVTTDIKQYSTVFSAQLRWFNYVTRVLADVRSTLLGIENEMGDIGVLKRKGFRALNENKVKKTDKMSAAEMTDLIEEDPHYRELKLQKQVLDQQRFKLTAWSESLERNLKTISRQIENRKAEGMAGDREPGIQGRSTGSWERRHTRPAGGEG